LMGDGSSAPAALPSSSTGMNLDELLGNAPPALPAVEERLALPSTTLPPAVPATTTSSANALDDLLGLGAPAAPQPPPQHDLDALGALGAPAPAARALTHPVAPVQSLASSDGIRPTVNVEDCAKRFLIADNGLLYEDANVQIGVKSQWQGSQGRVMFYVGNKSASADLQNFRMVIPSIEGLRHSLQPVPASIGPKRQVQLMLQVAITSAFASAPKLEFSYTSIAVAAACSRSLELPVRVTKFLSPMTIASPQEFIAKWHQMASAGQQQKIMDVSQQYATSIESVSNAFAGMRLVVHKGLDPNPANLVAGSRFVGERCGEVFVGVRVESDANVRGRYRFTVASMDAVAATAVMDTIVTALQ